MHRYSAASTFFIITDRRPPAITRVSTHKGGAGENRISRRGGPNESVPTKAGETANTIATYTKAIRLTPSCGSLAHAGRGWCSSPESRPVCALNPRTPRPLWPLSLFAAAISAVSFARCRARLAARRIATSAPAKSGSRGFGVEFCFRKFIPSPLLSATPAQHPNYRTKPTHRPSLDRLARSCATRPRTVCESPPRARRGGISKRAIQNFRYTNRNGARYFC